MEGLLTHAPAIGANDEVMAKEMADALHQAYPGHLWGVNVNSKQGIASVRNFHLSGNWGFLLHLPPIYSASEWKKRVLMGGGELLERYRQSRGRIRPDHIESHPVDFAGRLKADHD